MSAHKHGEPWEVEYASNIHWRIELDKRCISVFYSLEHANRAALCVNACAGMSDGDIRLFQADKTGLVLRLAIDTLKSQLAEAVGLLEDSLNPQIDQRLLHRDDIPDFLTKHKHKGV